MVRIYEHGDDLVVLGDDQTRRTFHGQSAALVRVLLDALREPRTERQLLTHVAALSGSENGDKGDQVVAEALQLLRAAGVVRAAETTARNERGAERGRVVVALSGGIAAAYAPALVELLANRGFAVRVAATSNALRFVSRLSLEALTHERVIAGLWPDDPRETVPHLALARWADVVVVYPATATTLSRVARGDCSTVVSALAISTRSPVVLVPAMNEAMLRAPSVQRNLEQLREDGFWITHPSLGYEVAEAPSQRVPAYGAAPPVQAVVDVIEHVFEEKRATSTSRASR